MLNSEFDDSLKFEEKRTFTREQIQQKRIPEIAKIVNSVDFVQCGPTHSLSLVPWHYNE